MAATSFLSVVRRSKVTRKAVRRTVVLIPTCATLRVTANAKHRLEPRCRLESGNRNQESAFRDPRLSAGRPTESPAAFGPMPATQVGLTAGAGASSAAWLAYWGAVMLKVIFCKKNILQKTPISRHPTQAIRYYDTRYCHSVTKILTATSNLIYYINPK